MKYDEFKDMVRKAWIEKYNYLYIDMTKNKKEGKYRVFKESKITYIECIPKSAALTFFKCCSQSKTDKN